MKNIFLGVVFLLSFNLLSAPPPGFQGTKLNVKSVSCTDNQCPDGGIAMFGGDFKKHPDLISSGIIYSPQLNALIFPEENQGRFSGIYLSSAGFGANGGLGTMFFGFGANGHARMFNDSQPVDLIGTQVTLNGYRGDPCENNAGNSGAALTLTFTSCPVQKTTVTANVTITIAGTQTGGLYRIHFLQDATGGRTYTWPLSVKWSGGISPTGSGANKTDIVDLYFDGANYFGRSYLNY